MMPRCAPDSAVFLLRAHYLDSLHRLQPGSQNGRLCAMLMLLSWTLTPSSVAGFIINDVQIPHMKGSHCGPDKRACVLCLSQFFSLVFSFPPRLASHLLLVSRFSRHISKSQRWKMSEDVSFIFSLHAANALCACSLRHEETAFCLHSLCGSNNREFSCWTTQLLKSISLLQAAANSLHFLCCCEMTSC